MQQINQKHIKQLMSESGINQITANEAGLMSVDSVKARELIGFDGRGIAFPYYNTEGNLIGYRIKQDNPPKDEKGKPKKYLTSIGSNAFIYFPKSEINKTLDSNSLYITEGEKKCLKATQEMRKFETPIISIAGCNMYRTKYSDKNELHPVLEKILRNKTKVVLLVDSDYFTNIQVKTAYNRLAKIIFLKGIEVSIVDLRIKDATEKIGLDDFLKQLSADDLKQRIDAPFVTFKNLTEIDIIQTLSTTPTTEKVIALLKCCVFLPTVETANCLQMIRLNLKHFEKKSLKQMLLTEKQNFPTNAPKEQIILDWDRKKDSSTGVCRKLSKIIEGIENTYLDESTPGNLIKVSDDYQKITKYTSKDELADFINFICDYCEISSKDIEGFTKTLRFSGISKEIVSTFYTHTNEYLNIPILIHHSSTPQFIDNKLICKKGFYKEYGILIQNDFELQNTDMKYINEFLDKIPFDSPASKANFLGFMISSLFCMYSFPGDFPSIIINADGPQSGKTSLARSLALLIDEKPPGTICFKSKDEEMEKDLATKIKNSNSIIFDNIKSNNISSPLLEKCLTDPVLEFRRFHTQNLISRRNSLQFMFTMNGGSLSLDLLTRCFLVQLNKHNIKDKTFKPEEFIKSHRLQLINELVYMVNKYLNNQITVFPKVETRYFKWATLINSILIANKVENFMDNLPSMLQSLDEAIYHIMNTVILMCENQVITLTASEISNKTLSNNYHSPFKISPIAVGKKLAPLLNKEFSYHLPNEGTYIINIKKQLDSRLGGNNFSYRFEIKHKEQPNLSVITVSNNQDNNNLDKIHNEDKILNQNVIFSSSNHETHDPFLNPGKFKIHPSVLQ